MNVNMWLWYRHAVEGKFSVSGNTLMQVKAILDTVYRIWNTDVALFSWTFVKLESDQVSGSYSTIIVPTCKMHLCTCKCLVAPGSLWCVSVYSRKTLIVSGHFCSWVGLWFSVVVIMVSHVKTRACTGWRFHDCHHLTHKRRYNKCWV